MAYAAAIKIKTLSSTCSCTAWGSLGCWSSCWKNVHTCGKFESIFSVRSNISTLSSQTGNVHVFVLSQGYSLFH